MNFAYCFVLFFSGAWAKPAVDVVYYYGGPGHIPEDDDRGARSAAFFLGQFVSCGQSGSGKSGHERQNAAEDFCGSTNGASGTCAQQLNVYAGTSELARSLGGAGGSGGGGGSRRGKSCLFFSDVSRGEKGGRHCPGFV